MNLEAHHKPLDAVVLGRIGYDLFAVEQNRPLAEVEHFSRHLGGSSANIAVGLARLGLSVGIISCLGEDQLADYLVGFLRREGVDTQCVRLVEGYNTSLSLAEVSPPDRFPQVFYRQLPADQRVSVGEAELEYVRRARMFVTNGTSLASSPSREATGTAAEAARAAGARVVLDVDYRSSSWPSPEHAGEQARKILPWVDVVIGNEDEVLILTGERNPSAQAKAVLSRGVELLILKLGSKGVEAYTQDRSFREEPSPAQVVSTIGAGDGFAAGFLFALSQNLPLPTCLRYGNAAAAVVVGRVSCSDAMPRLHELRAAISHDNSVRKSRIISDSRKRHTQGDS
ncbi:MAG TPA: 5-dehydro-2-deoxygluconokinase [Terriglobia bacterium]|nr:5-dehydro-2-deoxygluconokinase [Terriglobia bacterium]